VDAFGVFLRLACGVMAVDDSRLAVTHSFYDCSQLPEYHDRGDIPDDEYLCFMPFNLVPGIEAEMIFYPMYAPSQLTFSLDAFGSDGSVRKTIPRFVRFDAGGTRMLRVNVRKLLREHGVADEEGLYCLAIDGEGGRVPARLPFGMNFRKDAVGCNISHSIWMNRAYGKRKRLYLWGSLMSRDSGTNWIMISHLNKKRGAVEEANVVLKVYARDRVLLEKSLATRSGTGLNVDANQLVREAGYEPRHNEMLWFTLQSTNPNVITNQMHVDRSGFVGGDHSF
jgi:hypothetical protein